MSGNFTKNLLHKDKKGRFLLLAIHEDRELDLKTSHTLVGASSRLGLASSDRMMEPLGLLPGALTPFVVINDRGGRVTAVVDGVLLDAERVNFHPLLNTESTGLWPRDLLAFIRSCGRDALVVDLGRALTALPDRRPLPLLCRPSSPSLGSHSSPIVAIALKEYR